MGGGSGGTDVPTRGASKFDFRRSSFVEDRKPNAFGWCCNCWCGYRFFVVVGAVKREDFGINFERVCLIWVEFTLQSRTQFA